MNEHRKKLIIYIVLAVTVLAVYWQVHQFDFVNFDDHMYVTENNNIKSGITPESIRWAFSTKILSPVASARLAVFYARL